MGMRRMGSAQRAKSRKRVKARNKPRKVRERAARDRGMVALLQGRPMPYTAGVMSWIGEKLDMRTTKITQADIDGLVSRMTAAA